VTQIVERESARSALPVRDSSQFARPLEALLNLNEVDARARARKDWARLPNLDVLAEHKEGELV